MVCGFDFPLSQPIDKKIGLKQRGIHQPGQTEGSGITGWWLFSTPLKNMKVTWDDDIPNIWKNEKCSKPPTIKDCAKQLGIHQPG